MQTIRWYRVLAFGALTIPITMRAQGPQPSVKEIATIPGIAVDNFVRLPNGRVLLYTVGDSVMAYDLSTKQASLVTRGFFELLRVSNAGDRIVYCRRADIPGGELIWSMPINPATGAAAGAAQRVSLTGGDYPSFSPNGKMIAFNRNRSDSKGQDLAVVPATGGTERILAQYGSGMKQTLWSPDGKWIYVNLRTMPATDRLFHVERVPAAGGRSEPVFAHPDDLEGTIDGQVALGWPDANGHIAYVAASGARGEFRVPAGAYPGDDQGQVRFLLRKTTRPSTSYLLTFADGATHALAPGTLLSRSPVWSPDGHRLAIQDSAGTHREITVMNADGSQPRSYPADWDPRTWGWMQWSPNGQAIAYYSGTGAQSVAVLDLSTSSTRVLTEGGGFIWRQDGRSIVVVKQGASATNAQPALIEAKLDGTVEMLRDIGAETFGVGDGTAAPARPVAYVSDRLVIVANASDQFLVPTGGGPARSLPKGAGQRFSRPGVSPAAPRQAKWIVWLVQNSTGSITSVDIMTAAGDSSRTLHLPFEVDRQAFQENFYHPDGQHVILVGRKPGESADNIFLVPLNGGQPRVLAHLPGRLIGRFDVSADGGTLAYTVEGTPTSTIYELDTAPILRAAIKH